MNGSNQPAATVDLLGSSAPVNDIYGAPSCEPGKKVDLSGASGFAASSNAPLSFAPGGGSGGSSGFGGGGSFPGSAGPSGFGGGGGGGAPSAFGSGSSRGPTSIEGGGGPGLSLSSLTPANIMHQLTSRPVTELVQENGRLLMNVPRYMARTYTAAAQRYLQPWNKFARLSPGRVVEGLRQASRRGELQVHVQRNVLANAKTFCPNYAFIFLAMLFMLVCTNPVLLAMLGAVGGGWTHAMRSDQFRNRPWTLQIGGMQLPLGSNAKTAILSLPTLLLLHFFMGPVLWSAALYSGGMSLAHAALRDRDDDRDGDSSGGGGGGGGFGSTNVRIQELP